MDIEYFIEGYTLMMQHMRAKRILTKHKKFRRRLDKFYEKHKDDEVLSFEDELEYLKLEKYFYSEIAPPSNSQEQALANVLNILTKVQGEED